MKNKLNVAVIGMGVGSKHAEIYSKNRYCNLKILCDLDNKKLNIESKKYKNIILTDNAKNIFKDNSIDLVSISSYDNFHYDQVISCFKTNKHFFVEKPLCVNETQLKKIKKYYDLSNGKTHFSSNFVLRGNSIFKNIKNTILKKTSEKIYYIQGEYNYGRLKKITNGWRSNQPKYSINLGGSIHLIDLFQWINNSKVLKVVAAGNKISTHSSKFRYKDFSTAILEFENGAIGKITANFGCVIPHHHNLSIYTTKRTIKHSLENSVIYSSRSKNVPPKTFGNKIKYDKSLVLNSFISSIINHKTAEVTPQQIFDNMSICFALDKSLNSHKWENVNYY